LQFLRDNFLRIKAMEEVLSLKRQLTLIARDVIQHNVNNLAPVKGAKAMAANSLAATTNSSSSSADVAESSTSMTLANNAAAFPSLPPSHPYMQLLSSLANRAPLPPPSAAQESLLLQILAGGFIDHVARRMSPERKVALLEAFRSRKDLSDAEEARGLDLSGAYECIANPNEAVFIHPSSVLFPPDAQPEYLVYADLVRTRKLYMRHCTAMPQAAWLEQHGAHLVTYSAPLLANPSPIYDAARDDVLAYRDVYFGPLRWVLPRTTTPLPAGSPERVRHFLRLLLQGAVLSQLKPFVPFLLLKPHSLTASDVSAQMNASLTRVLAPFMAQRVDSLAKLREQWSADPTFFLTAYLGALQPTQHAAVRRMWPPTAAPRRR